MLSLKDKIVLITGLGQIQLPDPNDSSTWGIGCAIAVLFARQGANIFGGNRSQSSAHTTKSIIEAEGGICEVIVTDVRSSASVEALVEACLAKYGRIDILVNNVGYSAPGCPAVMNEKVWDEQMDLNLKSVFLTAHFVLPIMEKQENGGAIVSISSIAGMRYIGKPQVGYSASKAAVMQLMKATAAIYAPKGIRLNTVVPGLMETPYTRQLSQRFPAEGGYNGFKNMRDQQVPMNRMGNAWDVANAALFLASDEARYITGQKIVVDGGITSSTGRA